MNDRSFFANGRCSTGTTSAAAATIADEVTRTTPTRQLAIAKPLICYSSSKRG